MENTYQCPQCGDMLMQVGADVSAARYRCKSCGYIKSVEITGTVNAVLIQQRAELLSRIRVGLIDWKITQWSTLQKDIFQFMTNYESMKNDIELQMGIIACMTHGFNLIDSDKYKQCKIMFKLTEKMYKQSLKSLKEKADSELYTSVSQYKDQRAKYKKCRNDYRNTKLAWKGIFFIGKKLLLK